MEEDIQEQSIIKEQIEIPQIENMDNATLAQSINNRLEYEFAKTILVKQLPAKKVLKKLTKPEATGEKDENGDDIMEMVTKEVEVDALYREGIVISLPLSINVNTNGIIPGMDLKIGDRIFYNSRNAIEFDMFKDSVMIEPYNVAGRMK